MRLYPKGSRKIKEVKGSWQNPILRLGLIMECEFSTEMMQLRRSWILDCSIYTGRTKRDAITLEVA